MIQTCTSVDPVSFVMIDIRVPFPMRGPGGNDRAWGVSSGRAGLKQGANSRWSPLAREVNKKGGFQEREGRQGRAVEGGCGTYVQWILSRSASLLPLGHWGGLLLATAGGGVVRPGRGEKRETGAVHRNGAARHDFAKWTEPTKQGTNHCGQLASSPGVDAMRLGEQLPCRALSKRCISPEVGFATAGSHWGARGGAGLSG